jgi:membrane protease YdiL (CAAX protease family)
MKQCPYCGKEYPDDVERCLTDNEILLGGELETIPANEEIAEVKSVAIPAPEPKFVWTDRNIQIFEVILICTIAFSSSILNSTYSFLGNSSTSSSGTSNWPAWDWTIRSTREAAALGLLWYILMRHGKSFRDLGLTWTRKDIGWAIILSAVGSLAFRAVYDAIYFGGLTAVSHKAASAYVGNVLFGGGIFFTTILFQFLNPFFEELIVRAYVMTEVKQLTNSATKAIIISTLLQTSYHFYQGGPAAFGHLTAFLIFSIFYAKTNRITPIILAHLYSDVGGTLWYMFRH